MFWDQGLATMNNINSWQEEQELGNMKLNQQGILELNEIDHTTNGSNQG